MVTIDDRLLMMVLLVNESDSAYALPVAAVGVSAHTAYLIDQRVCPIVCFIINRWTNPM